MRYKIINLLIFCIFIYANLSYLVIAQDAQKDPQIPQIVGSEDDPPKEVILLWYMPENIPQRNAMLYYSTPILKDICGRHGYQLLLTSDCSTIGTSLPEISQIVINPDVNRIQLLSHTLNAINYAEVISYFTHGSTGNISKFINGNLTQVTRNGLFLGCFTQEKNRDDLLNDISRSNPKLRSYLFETELVDGNDYHYTEPYSIDIDVDAFNDPEFAPSATMLNNGILFLSICHSSVFKDIFKKWGASSILSSAGEEQTDYLINNFLFSMSCMLGEMDAFPSLFPLSNKQITSSFLNVNEAYSTANMQKKSGITIDPSSFNYNKTRSLLRSPHIEEIKISNAKKSDEVYYHYLYPDADKYNPTSPYPGDNVLNVANSIGKYEDILKAGLLKKPIPKDAKLKIYASFSKPIKDSMLSNKSIKAKLSFFYKEEIGDIYEEQNFEITVPSSNDKNDVDTMRNSNLWIGSIDLGNKENSDKLSIVKDKIFRAILLISYKDPQKQGKSWYLDTNGDGKWEDGIGRKDGAKIDNDYYDNNHWLLFGDIPHFSVKSSEISKLHLPLIKNGPPPDEENEQPLASDGFIVYPEEEYARFASCYSTLPNNFSSTYCIMDVTQQISSEYMPAFYLNKELLESAQAGDQKKTIGELPDGDAAIASLKTTNYPSYVANLRTEATGQKGKQDQCVPLSAAGEDVSTLRPFISLKMKNYQFVKGNGSRGENYPGSQGTEIDLSNKYDLYTVKGNPCDIVVSLPLKRVFGENIEAYEGKNVLSLETTNGGIDTGREAYSSQSLTYIKEFQLGVNA